ncbi:MAG: RraA family protein [Candidatus Brocadiia bacterium]
MAETPQDREELLRLYQGLRVADVRDAMDALMLHHSGSMSPDIRPVWRTRACGIARTARYLPYQGTIPTLSPQEYQEWAGWYYREVCPYPWMADIEEGDFCVIDQSGVDAGLMGSNNTLGGVRAGARGYVSNGGVRDTDEIILQKIPFWSKCISKSMVQGWLQYHAKDVPVLVGGVVVHPGDVVVADGDGVIVVPRKHAAEAAMIAHEVLATDKAGRRKLYEDLGMELDETVT